jgi:N-methylhydantoinase A
MRTKYRLGIDAGGTFTDLVLADQSGDVRLYKALFAGPSAASGL